MPAGMGVSVGAAVAGTRVAVGDGVTEAISSGIVGVGDCKAGAVQPLNMKKNSIRKRI